MLIWAKMVVQYAKMHNMDMTNRFIPLACLLFVRVYVGNASVLFLADMSELFFEWLNLVVCSKQAFDQLF